MSLHRSARVGRRSWLLAFLSLLLLAALGYRAGWLSDGARDANSPATTGVRLTGTQTSGRTGQSQRALARPRAASSRDEASSQCPTAECASRRAAQQATVAGTKPVVNPAAKQRLAQSYGRIPLSFEVNKGQTAKPVKFLSRGSGYSLFLTPTEAVLSLSRGDKQTHNPKTQSAGQAAALPGEERDRSRLASARLVAYDLKDKGRGKTKEALPKPLPPSVLRMKLLGANRNPRVVGQGKQRGISNYFIGRDKSKWRTHIAHYAKVRYEEVYPGIDLVYYGNQRQLEYDFIVAPGADPKAIRLNFKGARKVGINKRGDLVLDTGSGQVVQHAPVIYQEIGGKRRSVAGRYLLHSVSSSNLKTQGAEVTFWVAKYDRSKPLVIDPVLAYSTYLGGSSEETECYSIAVDGDGNAYVTGFTHSPNFPTTTGAFQTTKQPYGTAFVTKINSSGTALIYSTYLGNSYRPHIAVDNAGNAYVTGYAGSNFPIKPGAFQTIYGGGDSDAFVTKINSSGTALIYSTYLGGSGKEGYLDAQEDIAIDSAGNAYVAGVTSSRNFPITSGAVQPTYPGGNCGNGHVTKINSSGTALIYSTYLGGSGGVKDGLVLAFEGWKYIAVDSAGNAYITGATGSSDFPTTPGAFQTAYGGSSDFHVTKLNSSGTALIYSTYLGGSGGENYYNGDIAVDNAGNAYITGNTNSTNFPTTPGAFQTTSRGGDAFVTKLNATGTALIYSTYLGGNSYDYGNGIAVDNTGNAYITGVTNSTNFPKTPDAFQTVLRGGSDAFVTKLNATGTAPLYSTYLGGGSNADGSRGIGLAMDSAGNFYVAGNTQSSDFPTTAGAFQTTYNSGNGDLFVAKFLKDRPSPCDGLPLPAPPLVTFNETFATPQNDANVSSLNWIAGHISLTPTIGPCVTLQYPTLHLIIKRKSDGLYWSGASWVSRPLGQPAELAVSIVQENSFWYYTAGPVGEELPEGEYELTVSGQQTPGIAVTGSSITVRVDKTVVQPTAALVQADGKISECATCPVLGNDIYNFDAQGQTKAKEVTTSQKAIYPITIQNDAEIVGNFTIMASPAPTGWSVKYFDAPTGGTDITAKLTESARWGPFPLTEPDPLPDSLFYYLINSDPHDPLTQRYKLDPGAELHWRVEVTPAVGTPVGAECELYLRAFSLDNPLRAQLGTDVVRAITTVVAPTPTPTPEPTPAPTATSTPTPLPTATPNPNATPTPTPNPNSTPTPVPQPTPEAPLPPNPAWPQLPTPILNPAPGTYGGVVPVTLEPGAGSPTDTVIFYTRDGSTPTPRSPRYSGAFYIVSDTTVKARAFHENYRPSPIRVGVFTASGQEDDSNPGLMGVNILTPPDGSELTQPTKVRISVAGAAGINNANLSGWELGYRLLDGDSAYQPLASGSGAVTNFDVAKAFDPTLLLNGMYRLKLVGYYADGSTAFDYHDIVVKGGMKIGHFTMSFADITLPVAGLPITVTRTYDSRDTRRGDFGVGWTLSTNDVRLQKNGAVGGSEEFPIWRVKTTAFGTSFTNLKPRVVSITLPDGQVYAFRGTVPSVPQVASIIEAQVNWVALPGTRGTLKAFNGAGQEQKRVYAHQGDSVLYNDLGDDGDGEGGQSGLTNPHDPKEWELTLPSGVVLHLKETGDMSRGGKARIEWIRELNGNVLFFTPNGIESRSPTGELLRYVTYRRHSQTGFLYAIEDNRGYSVRYSQDTAGNLRGVTDRENNTTRFDYDEMLFPHYVTGIIDARGIGVARHFYDDDGRLDYTLDAMGNRLEFDHDIAGRQETVTDRMNHVSVMSYDSYGNVTATTRYLEGRAITTSSEYGDANNPDQPTKVVDALGKTTTFTYTPYGSPTKVTDALGRTTTTTYDNREHPLTVVDALGKTVATNTYWRNVEFWAPPGLTNTVRQPEGSLKTSTDANGLTTFTGYRANGAPWQVTTASGTPQAQTTTFSYDFNTGNLTSVSDSTGHTSSFGYDRNGNKTGQSTARTVYRADGTVSGTQTITISSVYDKEGRLIQSNLPGGASSRTVYNAIGKVDSSTDALNRTTSYLYNERGERTESLYPDGSKTSVTYNDNGQVETSTDRAGRGTKTVYDDLGRAVKTLLLGTNGLPLRHADGTEIASATTYDDAGRAIGSTDALGRVSTTTYNAAGEATDSTVYDRNGAGNPIARTTHTDYDAAGRAYKVTDALGRSSVTRYDDGGRAYQSERYNRNGVLLTTEQTKYDAAGRVDYTIDAAQNMKRMRYDSLGRLSAIILATQGQPTAGGSGQYDLVTSFGYDELGHKVWQRDANNRVTRFGYDERGRQTWRSMPNGQIESNSYNDGGQLVGSTDFRGYTTTYGYDTRGRMTWKQPDTRLRNSGEEVLTWSYPDENTRIAARGSVMTTYKSDPQRGWLSQVIGPNGTVNYAYNSGGERTGVTTAEGTTSYDYDVQGRLWQVGDQAAGAAGASLLATYAYDAVGNLSGIVRGNGVRTRYGFDEMNRLSDMVHERDAVELSRFHYTVRSDGKRSGLDESVSNNTQTAGVLAQSVRGVSYGYDNSGRLTSEVGNDGRGVSYNNAWSYDKVGNRVGSVLQSATQAAPGTLSRTTSISAVFNVNDWLSSQSTSINGGAATTQTWSYDANGAELTEQYEANAAQQNGWGFDGTLLGTGTQGTTSGGTGYSTDASGNRISVTTAQGQAAQKTTGYLLDENTSYAQVLEERAPDANDSGASLLQARYVWGGGLAPIAMWRRMPDGSAKLFYFLTDGQESVRQLTDVSGVVTDSYFYDAWGNGLAGGSGSTVNPFRYTGQMLDASGKYFLRARYYDSSTGRFLSHDPLMGSDSDPVTLHRYRYAGNDPVNAVDPNGMMEIGSFGTGVEIRPSIGVGGVVGGYLAYVVVGSAIAYDVGSKLAQWHEIDIRIKLHEQEEDDASLLYHYTDQEGYEGINQSGFIRVTPRHVSENKEHEYPAGQYFTSIPPEIIALCKTKFLKDKMSSYLWGYRKSENRARLEYYFAFKKEDVDKLEASHRACCYYRRADDANDVFWVTGKIARMGKVG